MFDGGPVEDGDGDGVEGLEGIGQLEFGGVHQIVDGGDPVEEVGVGHINGGRAQGAGGVVGGDQGRRGRAVGGAELQLGLCRRASARAIMAASSAASSPGWAW